jgi:hypothetical protein
LTSFNSSKPLKGVRKLAAYLLSVTLVTGTLCFGLVSGAEFIDFMKVAFCALVIGNGAEYLGRKK